MRRVDFMLMRSILGDDLLHFYNGGREFTLPIENVAQREVGFKKHIRIAALASVVKATLRQFATGLKLAAEQVERRLAEEDTKQLRRVAQLYAKFPRAVEGALHLSRSETFRDEIGGAETQLESDFLRFSSFSNRRKQLDCALQILNRAGVGRTLEHFRAGQCGIMLLAFVIAGMGPVVSQAGRGPRRFRVDLLDRQRHTQVQLRAFVLIQAG